MCRSQSPPSSTAKKFREYFPTHTTAGVKPEVVGVDVIDVVAVVVALLVCEVVADVVGVETWQSKNPPTVYPSSMRLKIVAVLSQPDESKKYRPKAHSSVSLSSPGPKNLPSAAFNTLAESVHELASTSVNFPRRTSQVNSTSSRSSLQLLTMSSSSAACFSHDSRVSR